MARKPEGLTRSELLHRGLLGMATLTMVPLASSCQERQAVAGAPPEPKEVLTVGYREVAGFSPGFHTCRGIAVGDGRVWVAGDMAIRGFQDGKLVGNFDLPGAVQAVAAISNGPLFVALDDRIVSISGGKKTEWESLGPRARLVQVLANGQDVLAADAGNRQVLRFGLDGTVKSRIGTRDVASDYPGLTVPSPYLGLALLPSGDLLVCNPGQHRLEAHTLGGELLYTVGKNGQGISDFCGCCNPMAVAVLPNGDVVTAEKGIPRVKILSPDGALRTVVAAPTAFEPNTRGLDLAIEGKRILVLDPWEGKVRAFEPV